MSNVVLMERNYGYQPSGAVDMQTLRLEVMFSKAGTGQVLQSIRNARFTPRHNAFTSLLQLASSSRDSDKAIEIFEAMKTVSGVKPNCFTYSALISALGKAHDWELAQKYFDELKEKAIDDPTMAPNTVTYAAIISAHEKRGTKEGLQRAVELFNEQFEQNVQPDLVTYCSIIAACYRAGDRQQTLEMLHRMHGDGLTASLQFYNRLIASAGNDWEFALEIFLCMQTAGCDVTPVTADMLAGVLIAGAQDTHAMWLLNECVKSGWMLSETSYGALLRLLTKKQQWKYADAVLKHMYTYGMRLDMPTIGIIVEKYRNSPASETRNGYVNLDWLATMMQQCSITFMVPSISSSLASSHSNSSPPHSIVGTPKGSVASEAAEMRSTKSEDDDKSSFSFSVEAAAFEKE